MDHQPVTYDLGTITLPNGHVIRVEAKVTIQFSTSDVEPGDRGVFVEDHFPVLLKRLTTQLAQIQGRVSGWVDAP